MAELNLLGDTEKHIMDGDGAPLTIPYEAVKEQQQKHSEKTAQNLFINACFPGDHLNGSLLVKTIYLYNSNIHAIINYFPRKK